jgi:hypothetical protein
MRLILKDRISTGSAAGSAISIPADHRYGEAIELRFTSALSNAQFQGIFMDVRSTVANNSTIRGMEITAQQDGTVAIGTLEGVSGKAITRSASTGNVDAMYGVTGEVTHNSDAYTGTVAEAAAIRGKFSAEDGATYTASSVFLAHGEAITGADVIGSVLRAKVTGSITFTSVLDITATATNLIKVGSSGQGGVTVSGGGMVKDPLNDAEAGYITIDVGGTAYQVPIYATA